MVKSDHLPLLSALDMRDFFRGYLSYSRGYLSYDIVAELTD
jgi:hypothetical protein